MKRDFNSGLETAAKLVDAAASSARARARPDIRITPEALAELLDVLATEIRNLKAEKME